MKDLLVKELRLTANPLTYFFILAGLMFFIPGYPILTGAFFVTLGLFHTFQSARESNDTVFSALLPIAKKDVVKSRYVFVCFIECCAFLLMTAAVIVRMTALADSHVYRSNSMMNANPFALGCALVIFGLFNMIFAGGFFRTAYRYGIPFLIYGIVVLLVITLAEAAHHFPGMERINAFGTEYLPLQIMLLACGAVSYILMTAVSCRKACDDFEKLDL